MAPDQDHLYRLRNRPVAEKLVDVGFKNITVALASVVAVVLFAILIIVFQGCKWAVLVGKEMGTRA